MAEEMQFLPRRELLTFEEVERIAAAFIRRGTRKIRLTGGEPLVRGGITKLLDMLGSHLGRGLEELTLTTNGNQLAKHARALYRAGIRRVNVSVDTLDPERFRTITRRGELSRVLAGIEAAKTAGLKVKINTVALRGLNEHELPEMMRWAHGEDYALTLIETMPMGAVDIERREQYLPLSEVRARLEAEFTLTPLALNTGGPARYFEVAETGGQVGFITPLTHNFCEGCNRVRMTATGQLYLCLGQEDRADLRAVVRATASNAALDAALEEAVKRKPKGHDFIIDRRERAPASPRHMSATGG